MKKFFTLFIPYVPRFIILVALVYGQTQVTLSLPDYMADIVNKGIIAGDTNHILHTGLWMLLITLLGGILTVGVSFMASQIAARFVRRLRSELFTQVEHFSLTEFNTFSTASLITRATNDMQQLQQTLVLLLRMGLIAPFMGIGAIIKAYHLSPSMSWIMASAIIALVVIIAILFSVAIPKFKLIQTMVDRLSLVTREFLTGIRVIRSFHKEASEERKFDRVNQQSVTLNLFVNRTMIIMQPLMTLIMSFTSLAIIWFGAHYVENATLELGNMMAFMQYATQAVMAFLMLSFIFFLAPRAMVSVGRISEVLASSSTITDPAVPVTIPAGDKTVEFRDVSFYYDKDAEPVLSHISFTAHPGETTAIIGGTGSGKTTLMNLIPRLYDVTSGAVLVGGVDVRQAAQADVRDHIGYATQKAMMFSGTVASNIRYGNTADDTLMHHAADVAAADFIATLPKQYDNDVARGGTNLSGGQKQRLSIARVIAKQPAIYLFDDTFSALDTRTEAMVRHALVKETKGKTVILVAQRISSIMHAEQILVLDGGTIVARGTHKELLLSSDIYREISESQLSAQELLEVS